MALLNTPPPLTSFVGRRKELAEVHRLVAAAPLVTLTGMGGCGKTRLALQAAGALSAEFADGAWLLELAALNDQALLPQLAVKTLGIPQAAEKTALESLLDFMSSRKMLLVLDNCEHLLQGCARLASELLMRSPGARLLATSREPLAIPGEAVYPLSGLAYPQAELAGAASLDELQGYDALQLLIARVQRYLPEFALTPENRAAALRICRRLDGMPLALELASARCSVLTLEQVADRLDDRFHLLVSRQEGLLPARHSSLRAAIDWSYELLSAPEQALLRRLSVFAAGCGLASVEAVCTGDGVDAGEILDLLAALAGQSLLTVQTLGRSEARYSLPETVRQYAQEKLAACGEASRLGERHLEHTLKTVEEVEHKLTGPYQQLWLGWLDGEYNEVRAALSWALESGRIEAGLRIALAIYQYWVIRDYAEEGLAWLERLILKAGEGIPPAVLANALAYAAFLAGFRGNTQVQIKYGRRAAEMAEMAGEAGKPALRWALAAQAYASRAAGDFASEFALDERVIQLTRQSGDAYQLGLILSLSSFAAMALGEYARAQEMLEESLPLLRRAGNPYRIAMALNFYGDLKRCQQEYRTAKAAYEESISLLREIAAVRDQASVLHNLGYTCLHLGDLESARAYFDESLTLQMAQANRSGAAESLAGFAALAVENGDLAAGRRLIAAAQAASGEQALTSWAATRLEYEHTLSLLQAGLTQQEHDAEGAAGRLLSLEGAAALARGVMPPARHATPEGLTRRELEIVEMVALGKSNGEIAAALVVSKRTVEKHIAHILNKLGVTNRSQIVIWALENGLVKPGRTPAG